MNKGNQHKTISPEQRLLRPACLTWSMTITLDTVWHLLINYYLLYCAHR